MQRDVAMEMEEYSTASQVRVDDARKGVEEWSAARPKNKEGTKEDYLLPDLHLKYEVRIYFPSIRLRHITRRR